MKQWNLLNPNLMQTHHFSLKFYAANIIFTYISVNSRRKFDFLWNKIWSQKYPHPLNPSPVGIIMQYFQNIFILLGALNVKVWFKPKTKIVRYALS